MTPFASVIDVGPEGPIVAIGGLMWVDVHHRNAFCLSNQEIAQEHGKTTVVFLKKKSPGQRKGCRQWSFSMNLQLNIMQKWIVYPKYHVIPNTFCCSVNFLSRFLNGVETVQSHYEIVRHAEYFFAGQKCGLAVVWPLYFMWTEHLSFSCLFSFFFAPGTV